MAAFPYYDKASMDALNAQAAQMLASFMARGYVHEEPAVLQPADIFLDRSGEEIRRRTFTLTDPSGRELCLRPDLTIPICRMAVEEGAKLPAKATCSSATMHFTEWRKSSTGPNSARSPAAANWHSRIFRNGCHGRRVVPLSESGR